MGVVGVAGAVAAIQMIDIDSSTADYMTKDLVKKYENSTASVDAAAEESSSEEYIEQKVYDPEQKVEYVLTTSKTEEKETKESKEEEVSSNLSSSVKETPASLVEVSSSRSESFSSVKEEVSSSEVSSKEEESSKESSSESRSVVSEVSSESKETSETEESTKEEKFQGIVAVDILNVRSTADKDGEVVSALFRGEIVQGKKQGAWIALDGTGEKRYVLAECVKEAGDKEIEKQIAVNEEAARRASEEKAASEKKASEEKVEAERKAAEEKAEAERKAAEEKRIAEEKAEAERKAEEARKAEEVRKAEEARKAAEKANTPVKRWVKYRLNVRKEQNATSTIVKTLDKGTVVEVKGAGDWLTLTDGSGYVFGDYLSETEVKTDPVEVAESGSFEGYSLVRCNVRQEASETAGILGVLDVNTKLSGILEKGWLKFSYNGKDAYVLAELLGKSPVAGHSEKTVEEQVQKPQEKKSGYVTTPAKIRKGPGINYDQIGSVPVNYQISGVLVNGWIEFTYQGQKAYIYAPIVGEKVPQPQPKPQPQPSRPETPSPSTGSKGINAVTSLALSKVGNPYVWGAMGPTAFDCSGLVCWAYLNGAGVRLPHQTGSLINCGYSVSMNNLRPGDLLFYNTMGRGVSHVTMYIGGGKMVHASSPRTGIRIDSIYGSYYTARFLGARRILN